MTLITWNDSFSVGSEEIDSQHRNLVGMLNGLHEAMSRGRGRDIMVATITNLVAYTRTHFRTEEDLFKHVGYPHTAAHVKEHQAFTGKITDFRDRFSAGKAALSVEVMNFLSDWLKNHIMGSDKQYVPFITVR